MKSNTVVSTHPVYRIPFLAEKLASALAVTCQLPEGSALSSSLGGHPLSSNRMALEIWVMNRLLDPSNQMNSAIMHQLVVELEQCLQQQEHLLWY